MSVVVADTGPLRYLVLIGEIDLLPRLFDRVIIPEAVHAELRHARAPESVREWISHPPLWLTIMPTPPGAALAFPGLDSGEQAALALADSLHAGLLLMDDRKGVAAALARGLGTIGTLGVLDLAARRGLTDLARALARLKATNFRIAPKMLDELLARHQREGGHHE